MAMQTTKEVCESTSSTDLGLASFLAASTGTVLDATVACSMQLGVAAASLGVVLESTASASLDLGRAEFLSRLIGSGDGRVLRG